MAYRISSSVVELELDNRRNGSVTGTLRLLGRSEPVALDLKGNCLRDLAGCRIVLRNPSPEAGDDVESIETPQTGTVGDITASRKVFVPIEPEAPPAGDATDTAESPRRPPCRLAKAVYVEWFSDMNGRVVIESADFEIAEFSEAEWTMTRKEGDAQEASNVLAIRNWMEQLELDRELAWEEDNEDDEPMDEFEWEQFLKDSDSRTDRFMELMERYEGRPEQDKLVARDMGWSWLDDAMDADSRGAFEPERRAFEAEGAPPELEPDPATEGVNWIRTEQDRVMHPLTHRASDLAMKMWRACKQRGLLEEDGDQDLHDMISQSQTLGAKLAGALNMLAYDHEPEGGFVVASLKRALKYFEGAIAAGDVVRAKALLPPEELEPFLTELFAIRESMIDIMNRYRESA
jgi:hypothetical protein